VIWCERLNVPDYVTSSFVPGLCLITIRGLFWRHNYPWHVRLTAGYYVGVLLHVLVVHMAIVLAHLSGRYDLGSNVFRSRRIADGNAYELFDETSGELDGIWIDFTQIESMHV